MNKIQKIVLKGLFFRMVQKIGLGKNYSRYFKNSLTFKPTFAPNSDALELTAFISPFKMSSNSLTPVTMQQGNPNFSKAFSLKAPHAKTKFL
jgi:hypothetical protein